MDTKPTVASPETFAAMLVIAERVAQDATVVINSWRNGRREEKIDWTYTPRVQAHDTRIHITVPQNRVLTRKAAQELLSTTRRAILDAWKAEGHTAGQRMQRSSTGGKTWVHTGGLFHMGVQSTDYRSAILIPRETVSA